MTRVLRLYRTDKGIWHYEIERDGRVYWSSLHTKKEILARARFERIKAAYEREVAAE